MFIKKKLKEFQYNFFQNFNNHIHFLKILNLNIKNQFKKNQIFFNSRIRLLNNLIASKSFLIVAEIFLFCENKHFIF